MVTYYCQKCLAANPFGQELCAQCGTPLMLVVEPPTMRYEGGAPSFSFEEHLLERVSALENRLGRITDRMEQALDLLLKQARNSYFDHVLIDTLVEVLSETGTIEPGKLDDLWRERCEKEAAEQDQQYRRERLRAEIMSCYKGRGPAAIVAFGRHIDIGLELIGKGEVRRGIRELERAAALAPDNAALLSFIGEHFFSLGKMTLARDYLARAFESAPDDYGVCLLLGLACGDEGEAERAKQLLGNAARCGGASFAAHYGLGRLLAAEQRWPDALVEFKRALAARPSPEAHYVVGCVYYQLGRDRMAARHLRKAIEMDAEYAAAFYMLGLVFLRTGEPERAREAFNAALAADATEPRYRTALKRLLRRSSAHGAPPLPPLLLVAARAAGGRLVTSGDRRLADAVREDALRAITTAGGRQR
jgi:tetratricopeptide (TPR) repeat protein